MDACVREFSSKMYSGEMNILHASACFCYEEARRTSAQAWMSRALASSSAGLSLTSLLLHLGRLFESSDPTPFLDCPVCPTSALDFFDFPHGKLHLPSVLLGLCLGLLLFPALELLLCLRGLVWVRLDRLLRPPLRYRLISGNP